MGREMAGAARLRQKVNADNGLIGILGDDDTVTGFLLAGVGNVDNKRNKNFLVVDNNTPSSVIEETFLRFVDDKNIAIILIAQNVADRIRHVLAEQSDPVPAIIEVPSKDQPYDPSRDFIMQRIEHMFAG